MHMTSLPVDKLQTYIATAKKRQQARQEALCQRRARGVQVAKETAQILRETFGVSQVVLFGSVLDAAAFHEASDLDLAV